MCPLWPVHYILLYIVLFLSAHYITMAASKNLGQSNKLVLSPEKIINLHMSETRTINVTVPRDLLFGYEEGDIRIVPQMQNVVTCSPTFRKVLPSLDVENVLRFNITGNFLGSTVVIVELETKGKEGSEKLLSSLTVIVIRKERLVDKLFTVSVAVLVSVLFVNFGCALDWKIVLGSFKSPVTLVIGLIPQFIFMPLISYLAGWLLFTESVAMQLGLFFTGISPSGGASNIWVVVLGGNLSLSIAITALGNLCAFVTMPLWTFTLGRTIFSKRSMVVPYSRVGMMAFSLMPPLLLGLLLQKKCPKVSQKMVAILKPLSSILILFIIVFATATNLYLFQLFTWKILLAGLFVPVFGFGSGWLFSYLFNRATKDTLAIAVETSVQNTGIAIFMLRFSLEQPEADLTTVIPVAVALMTPVPMLVWYLYQKCTRSSQNLDEKSCKLEDKRSATSLVDKNLSPVVDYQVVS